MGVCLDSRIDPNQDSPDAGDRCPLDLVERVDDDERRFRASRRRELLVALVVPMHDESLAWHTRTQREL